MSSDKLRDGDGEDNKTCGGGSGGAGADAREEMEKLFFVLLKRQQMQEVVRMMGSEFCCPVCQNLVSLATLANCGHMFCQKCIRTWCVDYNRRNCPVCRVQIVARIRALPVDRFVQRCLEEANDREALKELLAASEEDSGQQAVIFESDRAQVRSTSAATFFSGVGFSVRSTSVTSATGATVSSFGISSD
ncbi:hypothetical protein BOX15_Mlig001549g3 [Macrostomum lignano]|uniref:RING-type domain-containing protein n=1 Tax=Macrostomum lignano TaxID=282301 RepID=A0A267FMI9_9PLAT|nr:hypothetical protein BOX15_Mlig001549g2 [Macrostomum lignano]PAA74259.1 hypothetical protein BOX15_Mlig001549g6 [Macrostomum lignano]PAA78783.1 hypothetical protein BOX15_Mlig001549g5 [Macrostomum lignano]PAA79987.1 hypothetical protein BOX15_Mlig001549g3 [Macrostomum lignano]